MALTKANSPTAYQFQSHSSLKNTNPFFWSAALAARSENIIGEQIRVSRIANLFSAIRLGQNGNFKRKIFDEVQNP
jgi:hypothetical protein